MGTLYGSKVLIFPPVLLLQLLPFCICSLHLQTFPSEIECGVLYSTSSNYTGPNWTLLHDDQSPNLVEDYRGSPDPSSGWNVTGSFLVHQGCTLEACKRPYFAGHCQSFSPGRYTTELQLSKAASLKCHCGLHCSCLNVKMKWTECARAYLQGGCDTCQAQYMDFRGEVDDFDGDELPFTVFRLREGCTLKVYNEMGFGGDETVITNTIFRNFSGTVNSYDCTCDERRPPPPTIINHNYPPPVNVPQDLDQLTNMLRDEYRAHPGLLAALKSLNTNPDKRRSPRNAYILLLGSSGSGKSSMINLLFDGKSNLRRRVERSSTIPQITEFRIPVPVTELGIQNSELRIIETPGFGDTRGLEHDAAMMATLDNYLSTHEELKSRIPNVVLIFHRFHDNRFPGENSFFVRMLAGISTFRNRIMDSKYSNVIFVLTNFCSETKKIMRHPDDKLSQFKRVIETYSEFPRPTIIMVAENRAADHKLPMVNGNYRLPNGEYYPRNLFENMQLVTSKTGDELGKAVFQTFRNLDNFNVSRVNYPLANRDTPIVAHWRTEQ